MLQDIRIIAQLFNLACCGGTVDAELDVLARQTWISGTERSGAPM
jgi:hypothetical protein